jgi:hypothetical protein
MPQLSLWATLLTRYWAFTSVLPASGRGLEPSPAVQNENCWLLGNPSHFAASEGRLICWADLLAKLVAFSHIKQIDIMQMLD